MRGLVPSFVATALVAAVTVHAAVKPYISTEAEINTECKTCPRSLCSNLLDYGRPDAINVTCWTHGTKIMGDDLWLKTDKGCYLTQYDLLEYPGDYTTDLKYCGRASEVQKLTIQDAMLKYKTECRICPEINCDVVEYMNENTDLELTCWYPDGQLIIDDSYWLKTTKNCYVARKNLYSKPNLAELDNCGPIPLLEIANHNNENGTSDINKRAHSPEPAPAPVPVPIPEPAADVHAMYLINVTIGEEYSYCRSCANKTCKAEITYEFNQEVWLQCSASNDGPPGVPSELWGLTTDFCWINNSDLWEDLRDYYRFPRCYQYEGGGGAGGGAGGDED